MIEKLLLLLFTLVLLTGASCKNNILAINTNSQATESTSQQQLSFTIVKQGANSGLLIEKNYVIKTANDWQNFWQQLNENTLVPDPLPNVDFNNEMVLAVALGQKKTGGYSITVEEVKENTETVTVISKIVAPSGGFVTQAFTQPYCVIRLNKVNKNVAFYNY